MKTRQISFEARFIKDVPVKKYSYFKRAYLEEPSRLIEFDPKDSIDIENLENIAKDFGGDSYANNIFIHAKYLKEHIGESGRYIGITRQKDNFDRLDASQVLGVAELTNKPPKEIELEFLQVHPQYLNSYRRPSIKNTGTAILNYLKECYDRIILKSSPNATFFYKKNGFIQLDEKKRLFEWKKPD